jgi:putative transposase
MQFAPTKKNMNYDPNIHHRRSIRLEGYDYSQEGLYFVTICTENRHCIFGNIIDGEMVLNNIGTIAYNTWLETPVIRKNIGLDVFVIMPNHIHGIIIIRRGVLHTPQLHTPQLHTSDNNVDVNEVGEFNSPLHQTKLFIPQSQTIGAIVRGYKSSVTGKINAFQHSRGIVVWQSNYFEHIIRDQQSYATISEYILNNPINWTKDILFSQ